MLETIEERVDGLELILGEFMTQTGLALRRIERSVERIERAAEENRKAAEENRKAAEENRKAAAEDRKEWNKRWGELANKWGTVVEDIVAPNMPRIAREYFGCDPIDDFMIRRKVRNRKDPSQRREFDVIVVGADQVLINETKSQPRLEYINDFIAVLGEVEDYFPEYKGKKIVPIFASLSIAEDIVAYLTKHRIYAMAMGDETMDVLNFQQISRPTEPGQL